MKYDFTSVMDRRGMDAVAVDYPPCKPREGFDRLDKYVFNSLYTSF